MRDEQNAVNSVVVVMTDITDAALLQAKLAIAKKWPRLDGWFPASRMKSITRLRRFWASRIAAGDPRCRCRRGKIADHPAETQRTKDIVQDLLSFARQRPVQRELVQVNSVLRQTIKLRSYDFASHGVEVVEDFEETLTAALGDSQQLQQVFLNILNNAYDAVQELGSAAASGFTRGAVQK